ncbi:hypothetical protein Bca52824_018221 [Brassica carinata]|uniref:Uncharacterized protein n=1 Tax=Brassica carinata TaxID=52824 RepID=A0A8X8AW73_BRACI|nr:hypothetical protein Bca52824_018221 [Brassica carinata]
MSHANNLTKLAHSPDLFHRRIDYIKLWPDFSQSPLLEIQTCLRSVSLYFFPYINPFYVSLLHAHSTDDNTTTLSGKIHLNNKFSVKWIQCPVKKMREVVCHVLDHLREEGPQTATRRLETLKVLRLLERSILLDRAPLSQDIQSNIAPASRESYAITTVRGTKAATSSQARPHGAALIALRLSLLFQINMVSHTQITKRRRTLPFSSIHCRQAFSGVFKRFQSTCPILVLSSNLICFMPQRTLIGSSFGDLEYMDGDFLQAELSMNMGCFHNYLFNNSEEVVVDATSLEEILLHCNNSFRSFCFYSLSRNHNTVGGLGGEALFPVYWNGDKRHVLRVQKLLQITWNRNKVWRRIRAQPSGILQSFFTEENDTWKSWLNAIQIAFDITLPKYQ